MYASSTVSNFTNISSFTFHSSQVWWSDKDLTGTIPSEVGELGELIELRLWRYNIGGHLHCEMRNLTSLQCLSLWSNNLEGPLPPEVGNLPSLVTL